MKENENKPVEADIPEPESAAAEQSPAPKAKKENIPLIDMILHEPRVANLLADLAAGKSFESAVRALKIPPETEPVTEEKTIELMQRLDIPAEYREGLSRPLAEAMAKTGAENAELLAKGLIFEKVCAERERKAYIKGRNEKIELEKEAAEHPFKPHPKTEDNKAPDFFFHTPRKSVWDD